MSNVIKVGDLVYLPEKGNKIYKVESHAMHNLKLLFRVEEGDGISFYENGVGCSLIPVKIVFHATDENRKALEHLYGIELEKLEDYNKSEKVKQVELWTQEVVDKLTCQHYVLAWVSDYANNIVDGDGLLRQVEYGGSKIKNYGSHHCYWKYAKLATLDEIKKYFNVEK